MVQASSRRTPIQAPHALYDADNVCLLQGNPLATGVGPVVHVTKSGVDLLDPVNDGPLAYLTVFDMQQQGAGDVAGAQAARGVPDSFAQAGNLLRNVMIDASASHDRGDG